MTSDNRISAQLSAQDVTDILAAIDTIRSKLPFLITLSPQERKELARMGDKSIGFDEKCVTYMESRPEFLPGFVAPAEVSKDRDLRSQMLRFNAELSDLAENVDDTLSVVGSEVWMADLAFYQSVREAAKRNRSGAQVIYDDLRQRFPGSGHSPAAPAPAATVPSPTSH